MVTTRLATSALILALLIDVALVHSTAYANDCSGSSGSGTDFVDVTLSCPTEGQDEPSTETSQSGSEFTAYKVVAACTRAPGTPGSTCIYDGQCNSDDDLYMLFGWNGRWVLIRYFCRGEEAAVVTPGVVANAFQRIPIPTFKSVAQPGAKTLVNFETIFHAEAEPFTETITLLGQRVELRITPSRFDWDFGDGSTLATASPGAAYPSKEIVHRYQDAHVTMQHRLTITWTATYRLNGGAARPVPGQVVLTSPATDLRVAEATPVLSGEGH